MTRPALAATCVAMSAALITGCSDSPDKPPAAGPTTSAPATSTAPTTAPPPATPSGPAAHPLGQTVEVDAGGGVRVGVTAYSYRQPSAPGATSPGPGLEWASADVQMCLRAVPSDLRISVSQRPWRFAYRDGRAAEEGSVGYQQFPSPRYPDDQREILVGRCVRGWLTFPVPTGERPAWVEYAPPDAPTTDWAVPPA